MVSEETISDDAVSTEFSTVSGVLTCSSPSDNDSYITIRRIPSTQEHSREKHEETVEREKDEIRITGGTEKGWASKKKRRVHNEEIIYGERIADDLINEYCDKLNTALRNRFDGMLAIQYIALDPQNLDRLITGNKPVLQILLDQKREHYVLVERTLLDDIIVVFDSLATSRKKARDALNRGLAEQIFNLFNHLSSNGEVKVRYEIAIEKQDDMWSCGLRTVAYITCRAFDRDPQCYILNMEKVFKYFCNLLNEQNPNAEKFRHACGRFGKWRQHDLKAEEAIFEITKRTDHQIHIESMEVTRTTSKESLSDSSTTSSECKRHLKKSKEKQQSSWRKN